MKTTWSEISAADGKNFELALHVLIITVATELPWASLQDQTSRERTQPPHCYLRQPRGEEQRFPAASSQIHRVGKTTVRLEIEGQV